MKISVFITSFNQREYLRQALDSVLAQTLPAFEIIVVDDASSDDSQDLINDYRQRYPEVIVPVFHRRNLGVTGTRIDALNAVRGDYVTYLDGDDRFLPEKLELEAGTMQANPGVGLVYSNNRYVSEDGSAVLYQWIKDETPPQGDVFARTFARTFPRRSLFRMELVEYQAWKRCGFHTPELEIYEDFDMRIRLTRELRVAFCPHVLAEIRSHDRGLSKSESSKHFESLHRIYRRNRWMLASLDPAVRQEIRHGFASWTYGVGVRATRDAFANGQYLQSLRFLCQTLGYRVRL